MTTDATAPPAVVTSRFGVEGAERLEVYERTGGYQALRTALQMEPKQIVAEVEAAGLTGRSGGAGFPTATKWKLLKDSSPRYVVVNGDESEPGTCKDRPLMELDPHQLIEGALICAHAVGATMVVVYIRGEMALAQERMAAAIDEAYAAGYCGTSILDTTVSIDVVVHPGAGAYIVGEETALLESLEGNRGMPRLKPPFYPAAIGLYGQPTVVNNVETLASLPWIVRHGGAAFSMYGAPGQSSSKGVRMFSVSGNVARPGNYEVELSRTTFRDLFYSPELGGGIPGGRSLKAFIVGASFPWFFEEHLDMRMENELVSSNGSSLGSGIVVMDDAACAVKAAWRLVRFFARESCGKCTPCREGVNWLEKVMHRIVSGQGRMEDLDVLDEVGQSISPNPFPRAGWEEQGIAPIPFPYKQTTICPLGPSGVSPIRSSLERYHHEYVEHIETGTCGLCAGP